MTFATVTSAAATKQVIAVLRRLCWVILGLALFCLVAGYLGGLHPAGDSLAVFRVPFAGIAMIFAFVLRQAPVAALAGLVATFALVVNWFGHSPGADRALRAGPAGEGLTLYQQNMLYKNGGNAALVKTILELQPDVVTLEEVSARNKTVLTALQAHYPVQQFCPFRQTGGVAVLARDWDVIARLPCQPDLGLAALQVRTDQGPVWLAALHLPWPWPYGQEVKVAETVAQLGALQGPMVLAGDFNAVAWSTAVGQIAAAGGMARVGPYVGTFDLPVVDYSVGIDHVLAPNGWGDITVMPKFNSDHHGVLAQLSPLAPAQ